MILANLISAKLELLVISIAEEKWIAWDLSMNAKLSDGEYWSLIEVPNCFISYPTRDINSSVVHATKIYHS